MLRCVCVVLGWWKKSFGLVFFRGQLQRSLLQSRGLLGYRYPLFSTVQRNGVRYSSMECLCQERYDTQEGGVFNVGGWTICKSSTEHPNNHLIIGRICKLLCMSPSDFSSMIEVLQWSSSQSGVFKTWWSVRSAKEEASSSRNHILSVSSRNWNFNHSLLSDSTDSSQVRRKLRRNLTTNTRTLTSLCAIKSGT